MKPLFYTLSLYILLNTPCPAQDHEVGDTIYLKLVLDLRTKSDETASPSDQSPPRDGAHFVVASQLKQQPKPQIVLPTWLQKTLKNWQREYTDT